LFKEGTKEIVNPFGLTTLSKSRIESIDLLKGLVMIIMALDHTRDFFHSSAYFFNPTDPALSTLPIFFTRFVTHFCAPIFSVLAGMSAYLAGKRKTKSELSGFLIKRGLWLMFLELTIVAFGWTFDPMFRMNGFAVIWVLGVSMIFLAGLIHLPRPLILIFSCLIIFGHNFLDGIHFPNNFLWSVIHEAAVFRFSEHLIFYVDYPILPWVAVMSLGYWLGRFYDKDFLDSKRQKFFNTIGVSAIVFFFVLRWSNLYGDLNIWTTYDIGSKTLMSFLNISKYPPSLLYLLITLGVMFIFLANTERLKGSIVNFFTVFGRVPFFYYIIHIYLIHFLAMVFAELSGFGWQFMVLEDWIAEMTRLRGYGFSLWVVYVIWISVIAMLYPLCKWYDRYKINHKEKWWLSYL
jgi:uncharacterized membrane protein